MRIASLLILVAFVFTICAAVFLQRKHTPVLVAKSDLKTGTVLSTSNTQTRNFPDHLIPAGTMSGLTRSKDVAIARPTRAGQFIFIADTYDSAEMSAPMTPAGRKVFAIKLGKPLNGAVAGDRVAVECGGKTIASSVEIFSLDKPNGIVSLLVDETIAQELSKAISQAKTLTVTTSIPITLEDEPN